MKKLTQMIAVFTCCFLITMTVAGQSKLGKKVNKAANKVNNTKVSVEKAGNTVTSTVATVSTAKTIVKALFGSKKKDQGPQVLPATVSPEVLISINNIDMEDPNLVSLSEQLNKVKGVTSNGLNYDSGNALLKIGFNGTSMELWKNLSKEAKAAFKIIKIDDRSIGLQYRNELAKAVVN